MQRTLYVSGEQPYDRARDYIWAIEGLQLALYVLAVSAFLSKPVVYLLRKGIKVDN
jgi:hypothetical protein